jgi:D-tyrosyl-tRNA(Tyr) deacylase
MRVVVQRVSRASVTVEGRVVGKIGVGLLILVGFTGPDTDEAIQWMADKLANLRIFPDPDGKMNRSLLEVDGAAALVVSQFTLYGDARKGRRPSFVEAASPAIAEPLYQRLVGALRRRGVTVATGEFGAMMAVELVNDGPVTLVVER